MIRYKEKVARCLTALLLVGTLVQLVAVQDSYGEETRVRKKYKDKILVVQPKPILQRNRVELVPIFRLTLNDQVSKSYSVGGAAYFHILESLWVGGGFDWANFGSSLGGITNLATDLETSSGARADGVKMDYYGYGEIGYVPIMGKIAYFNSAIGYYDLSLFAGGGWMGYRSVLENKAKSTWSAHVGLTLRAFLADWVALNVSIRENFLLAKYMPQGKNDTKKHITNFFSVGLGFSIYIPFGFEYSQATLPTDQSLNLTDGNED